MLRNASDLAVSLLFPLACDLCDRPVLHYADGPACRECWIQTRIFSENDALCPKCGLFLEGVAPAAGNARCGSCDPHEFDQAIAIGPYDRALRSTILNLKSRPFLPNRVKELIRAKLEANDIKAIDLIVPVPLSQKRRLERGFNQAEVIAECISSIIDQRVDNHSLVRTLHTHVHRAGMDRRARERSVEKAFVVKRPKLINGRHILLVDDLLTSGATASNCADILKQSGAADVRVFTLARAARVA